MSKYYLMVTSGASNTVELYPEWDMKIRKAKIQDAHRTTDGSLYMYKWVIGGTGPAYTEFEVPLMHIDSGTKDQLESWWLSNQSLYFVEDGSSESHIVRIIGDEFGFEENVKPYKDLFKGTLKLSTY